MKALIALALLASSINVQAYVQAECEYSAHGEVICHDYQSGETYESEEY